MILVAAACVATVPAFADGDDPVVPEEPATFRVTSATVPIGISRVSGTLRASSAVLATRAVTCRVGETVTLTAPDGTSATVVADAASAGGAHRHRRVRFNGRRALIRRQQERERS
jgi:hypothetical protein